LSRPKIRYQALGRLLRLNNAAVRGYLEDRIVDLYGVIEKHLKSHIDELNDIIRDGAVDGYIPKEMLKPLFYPGLRFLVPVKLVDLDTLSFTELCERVDTLEQLVREFIFYKVPVKRALVLEDSFKLLRIIEKSKRKGSLSFELGPSEGSRYPFLGADYSRLGHSHDFSRYPIP
jgi:hypothetical protein